MSDTSLRQRILHILIHNTPPEFLAMPGDLSDLVTALIVELGLHRETVIQAATWGTSIRYETSPQDYRYVTEWGNDE